MKHLFCVLRMISAFCVSHNVSRSSNITIQERAWGVLMHFLGKINYHSSEIRWCCQTNWRWFVCTFSHCATYRRTMRPYWVTRKVFTVSQWICDSFLHISQPAGAVWSTELFDFTTGFFSWRVEQWKLDYSQITWQTTIPVFAVTGRDGWLMPAVFTAMTMSV